MSPAISAWTPMRALLQQAPDGGAQTEEAPPESTLQLRIIGLFVILVAGFSGGMLPLVSKVFKNPGHPATLILRAAAAGVILALAIIHVMPAGMEELGALHPYPFGPLGAIVGVLIMVATESLARSYLHKNAHGQSHGHTCTHAETHTTQDSQVAEPTKGAPAMVQLSVTPSDEAGDSNAHTHTCITAQTAASWAATPENVTLREHVLAYMFELACITHSILIGIALGVATQSKSEGVVLLLALVFHQGLEGIGLGSTLVRAGFSTLKSLTMIITYSVMTPLGVAIGIGIADSYDPESVTALAVQGTLNSVSAGLLLYISLVQLIAEDFTRADIQYNGADWLRTGMYLALLVGIAAMAIVGIWA